MKSFELSIAVAIVGAAAHTAAAGDAAPIVVESNEGARAADTAALLAPVYAELAQRGYAAGDGLAEQVRARVSADPGALTPTQIVDAQKEVERAYQRLIDGDYSAALAASQQAIDLYARAPGVLAREPALRTLQQKALLIAARSAQVLKHNDDAFRWMAEAIRTFPGQKPSASEFDPQVIALHRQVGDALAKQGGGTLEVRVDDAAAVLFVDEHFAGTGHASLEQLPPGRYRVYVAKGDQPGRVHVVDVAPKQSVTVEVSWEVDAALSTGKGFVAVTAPADDVGAAVRLARALGAPRVVVLGIRTVEGRRAVVGYGVDVESQRRSYAAVQVEPLAPPEQTMQRLAALLSGADDISTSDLITREPGTTTAHHLGGRRITALVVVGAAVIAGGVALGFDLSAHSAYDASTREVDDARQAALFETSNRRYHLAQGLAIAGVAGVAAAAAIWFTAPSDRDELAVAPVATSDGLSVFVSGRFW